MPRVAAKSILVRCLGPGKEHKFKSTDPRRRRVCDNCTKKLAAIRVARTGEAVHDPERTPMHHSRAD